MQNLVEIINRLEEARKKAADLEVAKQRAGGRFRINCDGYQVVIPDAYKHHFVEAINNTIADITAKHADEADLIKSLDDLAALKNNGDSEKAA